MLSLPLPKKNNPTKAKTPASRSGSRANTRPRCLRCQQGDTASVTAAECPWLAIGTAEGQSMGAMRRSICGDLLGKGYGLGMSWTPGDVAVMTPGACRCFLLRCWTEKLRKEVHSCSHLEIKQRTVSSWTQIGVCSRFLHGRFL